MSLNASHISAFQNAPTQVRRAIDAASDATGVDFSYLMNKAGQESSFRADAQAGTSSATGLFQFVESTWLDMVQRHGAKHGLASEAQSIQQDSSGRLTVSDPAQRQRILDMRNDPETSALMAAEYTKDNQNYLERKLDRGLNGTDLYMAHFLGGGGARRFLEGMQDNPNQTAANLMPKAAAANPNVFYHKDGSAKSLQQIYDHFSAKFSDPVNSANPAQAVNPSYVAETDYVRGLQGRLAGADKPLASSLLDFAQGQLSLLAQNYMGQGETLDKQQPSKTEQALRQHKEQEWQEAGYFLNQTTIRSSIG